MIHVHCGDSSAGTLRACDIPGKVITWSDVLHDGPLPPGMSHVNNDDWRNIRAGYLAQQAGSALERAEVLKWLRDQDLELEGAAVHDEIVFWFDACMFDQVILARHLDWLASRPQAATRASLVCVGAFPDHPRFKGLGELAPDELYSLFPDRTRIAPEMIDIGSRAWAALRAEDPRRITDFITEEEKNREIDASLPFLLDALWRFIEQYPSTDNGTCRLERNILQSVSSGFSDPIDVFRKLDECEPRPFFGDTYVFAMINRLSLQEHPLLSIHSPGQGLIPTWSLETQPDLSRWTIYITSDGWDVLHGVADAIELNGIDRWIGGVHLQGRKDVFRWDAGENSFACL